MREMATSRKQIPTYEPNIVEVKAKFECEFRRFNLDRTQTTTFKDFHALVKESHHLPSDMPFTISYTDPRNGDLLPITNNDNLLRAYSTAIPLLRLVIYRKQELMFEDMGLLAKKRKKGVAPAHLSLQISVPQDFRVVSSIVDADMLPDTVRRVKLLKHSSDRPLGFFIRDGISVRVTPYGLEKIPGIFISRLVPGGVAAGTGLLAVDDEILEVNGIEVVGKSLDQVTDVILVNSHNLIITVKPAYQPPSTPQSQLQTKKQATLKTAVSKTAVNSTGPNTTGGTTPPTQNKLSSHATSKTAVNSTGPSATGGKTPPTQNKLSSHATSKAAINSTRSDTTEGACSATPPTQSKLGSTSVSQSNELNSSPKSTRISNDDIDGDDDLGLKVQSMPGVLESQ